MSEMLPTPFEVIAVADLGNGRALIFGRDSHVEVAGVSKGQLAEIERVGFFDILPTPKALS